MHNTISQTLYHLLHEQMSHHIGPCTFNASEGLYVAVLIFVSARPACVISQFIQNVFHYCLIKFQVVYAEQFLSIRRH